MKDASDFDAEARREYERKNLEAIAGQDLRRIRDGQTVMTERQAMALGALRKGPDGSNIWLEVGDWIHHHEGDSMSPDGMFKAPGKAGQPCGYCAEGSVPAKKWTCTHVGPDMVSWDVVERPEKMVAAPPRTMMVTEAQLEKLGHLVDRIDNLVHAGAIPMPDKLRVTALAEALPDLHSELKTLYVEISGEDPWADVL